MSGLEIVGAIASTAQLGESAVRLIICLRDLSKNINLSAKRFQEHQRQIKELRQIMEYINETNSLQSEIIHAPIEALLKTAETLQEMLLKDLVDEPTNRSKKWGNRIKGIQFQKAEAAISKGFDDLERHKTTLSLCVWGNLGRSMQQMEDRLVRGLQDLQDQLANIQRDRLTYSGTITLRAERGYGSIEGNGKLATAGNEAVNAEQANQDPGIPPPPTGVININQPC